MLLVWMNNNMIGSEIRNLLNNLFGCTSSSNQGSNSNSSNTINGSSTSSQSSFTHKRCTPDSVPGQAADPNHKPQQQPQQQNSIVLPCEVDDNTLWEVINASINLFVNKYAIVLLFVFSFLHLLFVLTFLLLLVYCMQHLSRSRMNWRMLRCTMMTWLLVVFFWSAVKCALSSILFIDVFFLLQMQYCIRLFMMWLLSLFW